VPTADKSPAIIELELEILRILCDPQEQADVKSREQAVLRLQGHSWHDAEHRIVFDAIAKLPGRDGAELRRQLPAQATRMGFPDVHWETYFAGDTSHSATTVDENRSTLAALITRLLAASQAIA
jgi:hypothetical protein